MRSHAFSRRKFLQISAGAVGVSLLAACAPTAMQPADTVGSGEISPDVEEVSLQFWSEVAQDWATERVGMYMEENPGTDVEFVTFQWGEMMPKLMTASAGGTPPNLVIQDRFRVAGWAGRGGAHAIDDYTDQYGINPEDYWSATWAEGTWQGHVYAIPFNTDGRFLFWNKDIFEVNGLDPEVPPPTQDWEAMRELAAQLTEIGDDGAVEIMGFVPSQMLNYGNGGDYVYAWANGGEFMKDERTAWMNNPNLVETLEWQVSVVEAVGGISVAAEFSAGWPTMAGFSPFGSGRLAMTLNGDWNLSNFARYYPDLNFGMVPWHMRDSETEVTGFAGGFCLAVPTNARNIPATYEFMNYMGGYDAQLSYGIMQQVIPCLIEAALSEELIESSPYPELRRLANESMEFANFRPVSPVGQEIQDLWTFPGTGRDWVLYGEKTPQQACEDMQALVQRALDEYWSTVS